MLNKRDFLTFGRNAAFIVMGIFALLGFYRKNNNVLKIIEHPDPRLRGISSPIDQVDNSILALSNDMIATLRYRAIVDFFTDISMPRGLAATQVGVHERLVVCGINGEIKVMLNPEIIAREGEYSSYEDCMSVEKGDKKNINRSAYIKLRYKGLDNKERLLTARNRDAALLEHEIDHLNGVLNIDYHEEGGGPSSITQ